MSANQFQETSSQSRPTVTHFGVFRQRTVKRHRPHQSHPSRPQIFRLLTQTNGVMTGHSHLKLDSQDINSLDLSSNHRKQPLLERTLPQAQAAEDRSFYRQTRMEPFNKTSRPLLFLRPYTKTSVDRASLQKTKFQLYEQMHKYTEPIQKHIPVQYLTEYGDQFGDIGTRNLERKPKSLNISMFREKILRKTRPSRYLQRLSSNFTR